MPNEVEHASQSFTGTKKHTDTRFRELELRVKVRIY
jgi:hypothetical protein